MALVLGEQTVMGTVAEITARLVEQVVALLGVSVGAAVGAVGVDTAIMTAMAAVPVLRIHRGDPQNFLRGMWLGTAAAAVLLASTFPLYVIPRVGIPLACGLGITMRELRREFGITMRAFNS